MRGRSSGSRRQAGAGVAASAVVVAALEMVATGCSTTPAALPQATCGSASTHALDAVTQLLDAEKGALSCFETAMRHCQAASLAITEMGVDTGTGYVFAIKPGGTGCPVTELSQSYSANFGGSQGTITATQCRLAEVTGAGVTLSCAGQDVLIPATVTSVTSL